MKTSAKNQKLSTSAKTGPKKQAGQAYGVAEIGGNVRKFLAAAVMIKITTAAATAADSLSCSAGKAKTAVLIVEKSVLKNNNFLLTHI